MLFAAGCVNQAVGHYYVLMPVGIQQLGAQCVFKNLQLVLCFFITSQPSPNSSLITANLLPPIADAKVW